MFALLLLAACQWLYIKIIYRTYIYINIFSYVKIIHFQYYGVHFTIDASLGLIWDPNEKIQNQQISPKYFHQS